MSLALRYFQNTNRFDGLSWELLDSWVAFLLAAGFGDLAVVKSGRPAVLNQAEARSIYSNKV